MHTRTALIAAIVSGLAAVGLVAADVAWSLEARIETHAQGTWTTVAAAPGDASYHDEFSRIPGGCAEPELRLVVHNDKPFGDSVRVLITYNNGSSMRTETVLDETWRLDRFESRTHAFTIPAGAFPQADNETRDPYVEILDVGARVGDHWLGTCVQKEASA